MYSEIRPRRPARMAGGKIQDVSKWCLLSVVGSTPKRVVSESRGMLLCALWVRCISGELKPKRQTSKKKKISRRCTGLGGQ